MFTKDLKGHLTAVTVLTPGSKANTAAATSSGVDTQAYEGDVLVLAASGAITGTLDGVIHDSADNSSFAAVSGLVFTQVTAADQIATLRVPKRLVRRYIKYVGTVVTGPVLLSVVMMGQLKTQ